MSTPDDHLKYQFDELNNINGALDILESAGLSMLDPVYQTIYQIRGAAMSKLGLAAPRTSTFLKAIVGLSPGEARLFLDAELGWLVEALETPTSQPVRRYVSNETAVKIIKEELTHEEFEALLQEEPGFIA